MLSNDPPTFPPTSSRQILQLYCPDSRAAGAQATKGRRRRRRRGGGGYGMGKRMVSREIRGEGTGPPTTTSSPTNYPGLTSALTHPFPPHPWLYPSPVSTLLQHLSVLLCCLTTRERSANCEWCCLALPGLPGCVWQGTVDRRGRLAMWWERPFSSGPVEEQ